VLNQSGKTLFNVALGGKLGMFKEEFNLELYFGGIQTKAIRVSNGRKMRFKMCFLISISLMTLISLVVMLSLLAGQKATNNGNILLVIFIPITILLSVCFCLCCGCFIHVEHIMAKYLYDTHDKDIGTLMKK
jgi:hypothetical protein